MLALRPVEYGAMVINSGKRMRDRTRRKMEIVIIGKDKTVPRHSRLFA
jgi:hypothetical protein